MRDYGQVQCAFWGHPDIIQLSDQGKLLAVYLLTGPHSNGLGCYRVPLAYIQADMGWSKQCVEDSLEELQGESVGFCQYCYESSHVLIPKYLQWNGIANPKVAVARFKEALEVPKKSSVWPGMVEALCQYGRRHMPEAPLSIIENEWLPDAVQIARKPKEETVPDRDFNGMRSRSETVVRARSETLSKQEPNRTEPNRTFTCAKDGSHVDTETGEILQWGGVQ